jgi:peptidoglycan/LPS O-acetylase OafA/YrhL
MRNASAVAHPIAPQIERPRLVLVPEPAQRRPAPARQRLAALLAGLICGFVLAALAAVAGGGSPVASLGIAATLGVALVPVLVHARRMTVRDRRRARARRPQPTDGTVISLDAARAA